MAAEPDSRTGLGQREPRSAAIARRGRAALTDVQVTPMRRYHLRRVLSIERVVYPRPWSAGLFLAEMTQLETRCYLVATVAPLGSWLGRRLRGRPLVGYAGLLLRASDAHITTVAVDPSQHRRKVASYLLVALLGQARVMGAMAATLEVRSANRGAQRLYSGFGFAPVGVRPGYYAETGEDAVIMWAHDLQADAFAARLARQAERLGTPGGSSGAPDLHVPWVKGRVGLD